MSDDWYFLQRLKMVEEQLRARGIRDRRVLKAMEEVPRHLFLTEEQAAHAYEDAALPSLGGQTISQPFMVAAMSEALQVRAGMRVLEIGTGTGYQTAILAELARPGVVCSVERIAELSEQAGERLAELEVTNVVLAVGDGTMGWETGSVFDRIMITAAGSAVPQAVEGQLAERGVLVAPIGGKGMQTLMRYEKRGGKLRGERMMDCRFVPLIGDAGGEEEVKRGRDDASNLEQ